MDDATPLPPPEDTSSLMPWEDRERFPSLGKRLLATVGLLLKRPDEAGEALARGSVGPAIAFFALTALPAQWLIQVLTQMGASAQALQTELLSFLHLPVPPEPSPEQLALHKAILAIGLLLFPLTLALGVVLSGALMHAGLWMTRALHRGRGIEVTFRTVLYANGALSWISLLISLGVLIPGPARTMTQLAAIAVGLGFFTYQGILLAKAHGTDTWRGVLGIFLPFLALCLCLACCLGVLFGGLAASGAMPH